MKRNEKNSLIFVVILLVLLGGAFIYFSLGSQTSTVSGKPDPSRPAQCPMDAKVCPDGSAVGRVGPKCEFAPCGKGQELQDFKIIGEPRGADASCKDTCGDKKCEEVVCLGAGCPCAETVESCPSDCGRE